ncbi:hypothetical protein MRX96_023734 [Rhipicephalus microplus]
MNEEEAKGGDFSRSREEEKRAKDERKGEVFQGKRRSIGNRRGKQGRSIEREEGGGKSIGAARTVGLCRNHVGPRGEGQLSCERNPRRDARNRATRFRTEGVRSAARQVF